MKRNLDISSVINLNSENKTTEFRIDNVVGIGGSCIAYEVSYFESQDIMHKGILKEFCPSYLEKENTFDRNGHEISIPDVCKEQFAVDLDKFKQVYRDINNYLSQNLSAANYHTVQLGLYEGNNTLYTLASCDYGKSYDKVLDTDLYTVLKFMLAVTKAVELYHNAGFLHLDIKPKNVLILDEVADIIKLFDFDSLSPIGAFKRRGEVVVPVPEDYYVPELENCDIRNIGIHTDIFEIGAMLFMRIFGRAPKVSEMQHDSKIDLDDSKLLVGVSPKAKYELQILFNKTLQVSKRSRYQNTAELKEQLTKIISLVSSANMPYIIDLPKWQPSTHCIGRNADLKEVHKKLETDGYVFVRAIGGMGKSELVKLYAKEYADEYHTVQFCKYTDSLSSMIASIPINGINNDDYTDFNELVKEKNKVLHLSDSHTLLIVDNYNVTHDDFLREFLPTSNKSFKVIFTTRCIPAADYYSDKVYELSHLSFEDCERLFLVHSGLKESEYNKECLQELIETIDFNTLVLVLLATAIRKSGISLDEMLGKLKSQRLEDVETKIFHEYDFSSEEVKAYNKINAHLNTVFSVSKLTDKEVEILKNMTLIAYEGIDITDFVSYCGNCTIDERNVNSLIGQGWLQSYTKSNVAMHPIISDLIAANDKISKEESYYNLASKLEEYCNPDYLSHISVIMSRLSCAIQLERRYALECEEMQIYMKAKLGRLYANIYRPNEARRFLSESLSICQGIKATYLLPYIYSFIGEIEKDFGTTSEAIKYFELSILEGKKLRYRYYEVVLESMIHVAECYEDNNDNLEAFKRYITALKFARFHFLRAYIYDIASGLITVCNNLDWVEKAEKYEKLRDRYKPKSGEQKTSNEIMAMQKMVEDGDYSGGLRCFEEFLAQKREELGEDSPIYKDIAQSRWIYYVVTDNKEQALRLISEHLEFIKSTHGKESMEMANQLSLIAIIISKFGEVEYAIQCAETAIEICEKKGELHSYSYFQAKLALAQNYLILGQISKAKDSFCDVDLNEFSGNETLSDYVMTAGIVLCELSEYEKVEALCITLLKKKNVQAIIRTRTLLLMAISTEQQGRLDEAEEYARDAFNYMKNFEDTSIKKECLMQYYRTVARIQYRRGNHRAAIEKLNELTPLLSGEKTENYLFYPFFLERGLYYDKSGQREKADRDYKTCEKILRLNNLPEESFIVLYNNISKAQCDAGNYTVAEKYYERIVQLRPTILNPTSYLDAIICSNIGWAAFHLEKLKKAETFMLKAVRTFEKIGATNTIDYLTIYHNLALIYEKKNQFSKSLEMYEKIFSSYDEEKDVNGDHLTVFAECYLRNMMANGKHEEGYDFAGKEERVFAQRFGENSIQRIRILLIFGSYFKMEGYEDSWYFFKLADEAIEKGELRSTIYNATLLNYIGVCLTDFEKEHELALEKFKESKDLFEALGAENDEMYPVVISNIKYVEEIINA